MEYERVVTMPDTRRKRGRDGQEAQAQEAEAPQDPQVLAEIRHGVAILHREGVDSYLASKLCLALREAAKGQGLRGSITVRLEGRRCR